LESWHGVCEEEPEAVYRTALFRPVKEIAMINLTPAASKAISRFIKGAENPVAGLRIFVSGGGCAGLQYGLRLEQDKAEDDYEFDLGGATLLVDPMSRPMLEGLTVDFIDSLTQTGFKFNNPNATGGCACGQSFSA
jgi:iron-sulfur cluster assembly protein